MSALWRTSSRARLACAAACRPPYSSALSSDTSSMITSTRRRQRASSAALGLFVARECVPQPARLCSITPPTSDAAAPVYAHTATVSERPCARASRRIAWITRDLPVPGSPPKLMCSGAASSAADSGKPYHALSRRRATSTNALCCRMLSVATREIAAIDAAAGSGTAGTVRAHAAASCGPGHAESVTSRFAVSRSSRGAALSAAAAPAVAPGSSPPGATSTLALCAPVAARHASTRAALTPCAPSAGVAGGAPPVGGSTCRPGI